MGGSPTYNPPAPDPELQATTKYNRERQIVLDTRADAALKDTEEQTKRIKLAGETQYKSFITDLQNRFDAGLTSESGVTNEYTKYLGQYGLGADYGAADVTAFKTRATTKNLADRSYLAQQTYRDILGREATSGELAQFESGATRGRSLADLAGSLRSSEEGKNRGPASYLEAYNDTMFGKQVTERRPGSDIDWKTGKYAFTYDPSLDPTFTANTTNQTGVNFQKTPTTITGTPDEIANFQKGLAQKRDFMYNAGLTSLQGKIDTDIQKIKEGGTRDIANIQTKGQLLSNLTAGFWS